MPPRLNKRQQRELEELEALGGPERPSGSESADDEAPIIRNQGMFAAASLLSPEGCDDDSDDGEPARKSKKSKKKKKKSTGGAKAEKDGSVIPAPKPATQVIVNKESAAEVKESLTASERKALKKAKQKQKKTKDDDLDRVFAELSIQLPTQQQHTLAAAKGRSIADLLGVSLQHLDAEAELRKFFGSRVVQANKTGSAPSSSRRTAGALRSNLTRPRANWWSASQREGLSIRTLTNDEVKEKLYRRDWDAADEKWWTVEYSKKYKSMTRAFMRTVMSGDPQGFYDLLRKLPWHADTLLQLAEVYRHREEHAQAVDFIDRALFTYERSFIGAFNLTSGSNRLDFDRVENRPFFLAIHRQVVDLQRRGCARTGFEFARLLYSLDPWTDPHGVLLHLDQVSIKANMSQWLVDVYNIFNSHRDSSRDTRLNPSLLPGWAYGYALALRALEKDNDHTTSTTALTEAIKDFPSIVPLLADKLDASLPASVRSHPDCIIKLDGSSLSYAEGILHLLSHLYAQRSFPLWKDHASWFAETATTTFASIPSPNVALPLTPRRKAFLTLYENSETLQYSVYRHVIVLESSYRRLFSFIPRHVLEGKSLACDPLPPKDSVTLYDDNFFEGTEDLFAWRPRTRREREMDQRRLAQMIPDAGFRQQLEVFFEAQGLEQRFPGGIVQFAQVIAQLAPEELEDMMVNGMLALGEGGDPIDPGFFAVGAGGMPGQMPGENMLAGIDDGVPAPEGDAGPGNDVAVAHEDNEGEDEGEDEDEEDEEDDIAPMPRMIRNILGRLWGRAAPAEESSSSEDDDDENAADLNAVD
ncbi:DUF654-domain-containing protein [Macrolepiota fuliginosa MF-IS2]|uniref:DUF654-domain-containing protein n=1 Tax=Macrolepiota fuliginosa MF-IS2 TaxID=1400762 RepID=A0A9P5XCY3_9AGAR|nr:DUF654-domain-containing protein [Macrolepiota fuliginosa MF-IS2]